MLERESPSSPIALNPEGVRTRCGQARVTVGSVLRRLAIAAIVAICLGGPIAEMFDQWDPTDQPGNDTEANVVVAAMCIGVVFAIGTIVVVSRIRSVFPVVNTRLSVPQIAVSHNTSVRFPIPTASPPATLRL